MQQGYCVLARDDAGEHDAQRFGNLDRTVLLLIVLQNRNQRPSNREA